MLTQMSRRLISLTGALLACAATLVSQGTAPASPQRPDQEAPRPFRVAVDVVAVDVQVIDRDGRPVPDLSPEKFSVTINGRRRRVVSAERIGSASAGEVERTITSTGVSAPTSGRVIVLAVDCISFDATASRGVIQSVRAFMRQLSPDDFVGLSAYPNGPQLDPTTDHAAVLRALDTVVGQRDMGEISRFNIRPSEIIDMTRELNRGGGPTVDAIVARECGALVDMVCQNRLITDVTGTALYYEGQATASLGMLRSLVQSMTGFLGRKTLLLISGGMVASDTPGGRPDLSELGIQVGKEAALANTTIYTLYIDSSNSDRFAAQTRAGDKSLTNWNRDSFLLARWLEQFTGAAGGALFPVYVGNAESALSRIHTELSSYYLLGVEPGDEDRDGRMHEITVKTSQPNVTIRGRRWVTVPKRAGAGPGSTTAVKSSAPAGAAAPAAPSAPAGPAAPPPRVVPADVQALADTFDRGSYDAMQQALARSKDLASTIRGFRMGDSPWPNDPKRTAVFALEVALAGLRSDNGYARDEGGRLLSEYHTRVRQPSGADAFECWWFVTEAAALEGLFLPESAMLFIPRALQRCPTTPRLHLAYAFVSEQQWLRGGLTPAQELDVVSRYEAAMKFPETEPEARVRAARFLYGLGNFPRALELLNAAPSQSSDQEVRYLADLVRGQILRAHGRSDEAVAAFRAALVTWPGAQSARVALMTLLLSRGDREEAAALAEAAQTASQDQFDPWWTYWLGDYRAYPTILDKLREMAR
jgi:VWFA-related protein